MLAEQDFAGRQSRGARETQQDSYAFYEFEEDEQPGLLLVVADGMGGHAAGEHASELAVHSFVGAFHGTDGAAFSRMRQALSAANEAIAHKSHGDLEYEGMGTTLLAVSLTSVGLHWISVGDSPLYLLSDGKLRRLNADHSLRPVLKELESRKAVVQGTARMGGNLLRAALSGKEIALIDQSDTPLKLAKEDVIIAATDGIHTLASSEILDAVGSPSAHADTLADKILAAIADAQHPGQDNTTIAIIKAASDEGLVLPL